MDDKERAELKEVELSILGKYRVRVLHASHGCDTGCCGHTVTISNDNKWMSRFEFDHPGSDDVRTWARHLAEQTIAERWPECLDSIDWDTLDVSEVRDD